MDELFEKLSKEEDAFFASHFLCPVIQGIPIRVRIANIVCELQVVKPKKFEGWGVFRAKNSKEAQYVRAPKMAEKQSYLKLFPPIRLIISRIIEGGFYYGILANSSSKRFTVKGLVPVRLAEEIQMFDTVIARFDGKICWFDSVDEKYSTKNATQLREHLANGDEKEKVDFPGLTLEERNAYALALESDANTKKTREENKIKTALHRAGAKYHSHVERDNTYTIEYNVGTERHRSVINKDNLQVQSAGICLSGGDRLFDLQSLVGVIRQGQNLRRIVRVGENAAHNYEDDDYGDDY